MEKGKYAVAIVGYGGMGCFHKELIKKVERLFVCGVYDIKEKRNNIAQKEGFFTYKSLKDVLSDPKVDIILIATPNDSHKSIAVKSMEAGKHVICEKPVTLSSADLQEMIDASVKNNRHFTVNQNRRWDEDFLIAKKIYTDNLVGQISRMESRVHGSRGIPGDWRGKKEHGGGMVLDWGVHIFDQILQLVPEKIKSVYACLSHITNDDVDDGFTVQLCFESGMQALLEVGTRNFINLPRWYILGENGTAQIDGFDCSGKIVCVKNWADRDALPVKTAAGLTKTMAPRTADSITELPLPRIKTDIVDFYNNVVDVTEKKAKPIIKHDELMRVMGLMETVFQSADNNTVMPFE